MSHPTPTTFPPTHMEEGRMHDTIREPAIPTPSFLSDSDSPRSHTVTLAPESSLSHLSISKSSAPPTPPSLYTRISTQFDHAILHLAPSFFSLNMGTGITSILLHNLPYNARWLRILGTIIFVLNVVIFALLVIGNLIRYTMYKGLFTAVNKHCVSGMFWGCLPMGMATIVNMICFVCVPAYGKHWALLALGLWWINVVMSILVNLGMIFMMFARQSHTDQSISSTWLLPIVSSVVAAASGGIVADALQSFSTSLSRSTVIVSYVVWGTGVPLALMIIALWIYRTALYGVPAPAALPSAFLPLGPCGQGSFGIALLGKVVRSLAYEHNTPFAIAPSSSSSSSTAGYAMALAEGVYASGLLTSLVLWGLGFCFYILATALFIDQFIRQRNYFGVKSFSIGFTALTFPIGVWATATTTLATELHSDAFKVIGTVVSIQVALNWVYVMSFVLVKAWQGTIWMDPCTAGFEGGRPQRRWGSLSVVVEEKQ